MLRWEMFVQFVHFIGEFRQEVENVLMNRFFIIEQERKAMIAYQSKLKVLLIGVCTYEA